MPKRPKDTRLKRIEGNPGGRPLSIQPEPQSEIPLCPSWLDSKAMEEWDRITPELRRLGLLSQIDVMALAVYCQAVSHWQAAEEIIQQEGLTIKNQKGNKVTHPAVRIMRDSMQTIRAFCIEFGLTPSSRRGISIQDPNAKEDDFFKVKRFKSEEE